jgi:hypothetical protein
MKRKTLLRGHYTTSKSLPSFFLIFFPMIPTGYFAGTRWVSQEIFLYKNNGGFYQCWAITKFGQLELFG